jgi:hypothetical protein
MVLEGMVLEGMVLECMVLEGMVLEGMVLEGMVLEGMVGQRHLDTVTCQLAVIMNLQRMAMGTEQLACTGNMGYPNTGMRWLMNPMYTGMERTEVTVDMCSDVSLKWMDGTVSQWLTNRALPLFRLCRPPALEMVTQCLISQGHPLL